jgi:crotonobetainyl-CoA:carnitine CoA-transferase CaiB-like acyl-CoA transferase
MAGVLQGIRVIDFGQYIAGPLAAMILADQGADVVRIDPPSGPKWDTPGNATWNRGKRSLLLDLKQDGDLEIAKKLIGSADVVIENFRPGVMDRLGLGSREMVETNSRLIYCSMPGFAADDPRAALPGWEGIIAAATGTYRPSENSPSMETPVYTAVPIASSYAAFLSSVSITMALLAREQSNLGQTIVVPLFDSMFTVMGGRVLTLNDKPDTLQRGNALSWTRQYECEDGAWLQYHSGNSNFREFIEAAGASWIETQFSDAKQNSSDKSASLADYQGHIRQLFKSRTSKEWEDLVANIGSEAAICRTTAEWMSHPHARQSGMIIEVLDKKLGNMLQPGINARLNSTPGAVRGPAPEQNAHKAELLAELDSLEKPVNPDRPTSQSISSVLEGTKVLDLCIVLAGPTCGRTLAEFGSSVIKIDSPYRQRVSFHNEINRAKRSIVLDLKTEEGLSIFWKLLEDADVVVQNFRKDVAEKLGIGYEQVKARKPDIIYASLNTYGQEGPWALRPGHEQIAQAATGMQERYGGSGQPLTQPWAVNDYGTGFMGAFAVGLALLHRNRTGEGQHVNTALAYTACTLQSTFMQDFNGKVWNEARGQDCLGTGPLNRAYKTDNGWMFLVARKSDLDTISKLLSLPGLERMGDRELELALVNALAKDSTEHWVGTMNSSGIAAHEIIFDPRVLLRDPWVIEHGLSVTRDHMELGSITTTGPAPRLSLTPLQIGRPAPKPGSDAQTILEHIGLGNQFQRLVEENIIRLDGIVPG